jgi:hypothetical protein
MPASQYWTSVEKVNKNINQSINGQNIYHGGFTRLMVSFTTSIIVPHLIDVMPLGLNVTYCLHWKTTRHKMQNHYSILNNKTTAST